jgi:peroxiredoxin
MIAFSWRAWLTAPAFLLVILLSPIASAEDLGPAVGTVAPSIGTPTDQTGKPRALADLMGDKGLVLMFFRSAKWCPYCQGQLLDMNTGVAEIEKRGYRIAALSYDSTKILADFTAQRSIGFTFLSDPKSEVIDRYKLRDPQYPAGSFAYGVPRPIIFILDTHGVIKAKLFEETYKTRPPVATVIAKLDALAATD